MHQKPILILPIETYAREIDHKLLLGNYLALKTGCVVLIAHSSIANEVAILAGSESIYIGKNIFISAFIPGPQKGARILNHELFKVLNSGSKLVFVDEEGGLFLKADYSDEDVLKMKARLPISPGDNDSCFRNVTFCHWGEYQNELANSLYPNMRHRTSGWPNIDAAKAYRNHISKLEATKSIIGLTSNGTFLGSWAHQGTPLYLSLSRYINKHGMEEVGKFIDHETSLPELAVELTQNGYRVLYRHHPASAGANLNEWIDYCKKHSIETSNPIKIPSIQYLSGLSVNIHNGCSTAITSCVLGLPTIRYRERNTSIGTSLDLATEAKAENLSEVLSHLKSPKVPQVTDKCLKIISGVHSDKLNSFETIFEEVQRFRSVSKTIQPTTLSSINNMLIKQLIKDYAKTTLTSCTGFKKTTFNKFTTLFKQDIDRNIEITRSLYPLSKFKTLSFCSKGIVISAHTT